MSGAGAAKSDRLPHGQHETGLFIGDAGDVENRGQLRDVLQTGNDLAKANNRQALSLQLFDQGGPQPTGGGVDFNESREVLSKIVADVGNGASYPGRPHFITDSLSSALRLSGSVAGERRQAVEQRARHFDEVAPLPRRL
jgi:hypothetical protein